MYNLYKTELKNYNFTSSYKNKSPKSTKVKPKKIKINNLLSRNDLNKKIINESKNRKILSENYLDFMVKEKLNYASVDKIISHYSNKIDEYKKKFDENQNIIKKKKEELKNMNMALYTTLVKYVQFYGKENEEEKPEDEIDKVKKEIQAKEHEIEVYKDLYNESYKLNLNLSNKYSMENNYSKVYDEQYQRYNNIYTGSINKIQAQENKLNLLNGYFHKYKIINNSLLSEKFDKLNKLEYEIVLIKNNVVDFEENFAKIQEKNNNFQKLVDLAKNGYNIRKNDYNSIKKYYLKEYLKMFEIYEIFKVENIEHILSQFVLIKQKYLSLSSKFNKSSKDLMLLKIELTGEEKKLNEMKKELKERNKNTKINIEKSNKDLDEIINMQKNDFNLTNVDLFNQCINKENLINICINYLVSLRQKIIFSLNNSINKSPLISKKKFDDNKKKELLEDINSAVKMREKNLVLLIIKLFKSISTKIYEIVQNVLYNIYLIINEKKEEQSNDDENINEIKINIIKNDSDIVKKIYETQLREIRNKLKLKKQIYSRNKDNLILNNKKILNALSSNNIFNEKEKKIFIKKQQIISPKDLFDEYTNYTNKNNKNNNKQIISNDFSIINKNLFIKKYANELVAEKDLEKIKEEKMRKVKEASRIINNKLEEKELRNYLNKKENKNKIIKLKKKIKISKFKDEEEEEEMKEYEKELILLKKEMQESKKPKKYKIKLANPENNLISNRFEEIRRLEISYIKNYSDYRVEQNIFNEYFYNARKKIIDKNKKQNSVHELNNSHSTRNLFNNKKSFGNFSIILPKIENKIL